MFGFYNRLLTIDLSKKHFFVETIDDQIVGQFLGGKGLATHLLLERNPTGVDPFSPRNQIIIATGPLCQSRLWGGSRYGVDFQNE